MGFRLLDSLKRKPGLAVLATCAFCAVPFSVAQAQTVTENLTADLSGFTDIAGTQAAPVSAIDASFSVTFNPSLAGIPPTTSGLVVNSYSGPTPGSPFTYDWSSTLQVLTIGASPTTNFVVPGQSDVVFQFNLSNLAAPKLSVCSNPGFNCDTANGNSLFYASGYTLASNSSGAWLATVANGVSVNAAPEIDPASATSAVTLLLGGLLMINSRRRSSARSAVA